MIRAILLLLVFALLFSFCYVQKSHDRQLNRSKMMVTAQVVLKSKSGENPLDLYMDCIDLEEYQASKKTVEMIRQHFSEKGFMVDEYMGVSFQISGPLTHFERFLGIQIEFKGSLKGQKGSLKPLTEDHIDGILRPFVAAIFLDDPFVYINAVDSNNYVSN